MARLKEEMDDETLEHLPQKGRDPLTIYLPSSVKERLRKIASYIGIPAVLLCESEITKLVMRNWDRKNKRPKHRGGE